MRNYKRTLCIISGLSLSVLSLFFCSAIAESQQQIATTRSKVDSIGSSMWNPGYRWEPYAAVRIDSDYALTSYRVSLLRPTVYAGMRGRLRFASQERSWLLPDRLALIGRARHMRYFGQDALQSDYSEAEWVELSGEWLVAQHALKIGVQELVWGETIGLPLVDLVHARDQREPIFTDPSETRLPAAMAVLSLAPFANWNWQSFVTPLPPKPRLPKRRAELAIIDRSHSSVDQEAEFGTRLGWLSPSGIDTKIYALRHASRIPIYEPVIVDGQAALSYHSSMLNTAGAGLSYAAGAWVLRGDFVRHLNQAFWSPSKSSLEHGAVDRLALGIDWSGEDTRFFALQYSQDQYASQFASLITPRWRRWMAGKFSLPLAGRSFKVEGLVMQGLGHRDLWLQPRVLAETASGLSVELRADLLSGDNQLGHYFGPDTDADRLRLTIKYLF